jgi:hypothetical protein
VTNPVYRQEIPYGFSGSVATLQRMRSVVRASLRQEMVIRIATRIVMYQPQRDQISHAYAIRAWLDERFRFVPDPRGVEMIRTPLYQLREIEQVGAVGGDCDDAAVLGAALAMAVGIPAWFRIVKFRPGADYAHVFAVLTPRAGPAIDLDVTKPAQGAAVPIGHKDFRV